MLSIGVLALEKVNIQQLAREGKTVSIIRKKRRSRKQVVYISVDRMVYVWGKKG
jgi:translation initiation factor 1 (eIF-1/SUI1)